MNILNEYGQFINLAILIGLAVFLFRKIKAIDYNYYLSTFIGSFWAFLLQTIKFKNGIPFKQKAKEFFLNLPHINKKILGKNLLIYYVGCIIVGLIDLLTDKMKFSFYEFFIESPIAYFFITIFLIFIYFIMKFIIAVSKSAKNYQERTGQKSFFEMVNEKSKYGRKQPSAPFRKSSTSVKEKSVYNQTKETQSYSKQNVSNKNIEKEPNMKSDSTQRKMCAMCTFWTGQRAFKGAGGNFFEYEDVSAKCSPNGGRPNTMMSPRTPNLSCFQKWG